MAELDWIASARRHYHRQWVVGRVLIGDTDRGAAAADGHKRARHDHGPNCASTLSLVTMTTALIFSAGRCWFVFHQRVAPRADFGRR